MLVKTMTNLQACGTPGECRIDQHHLRASASAADHQTTYSWTSSRSCWTALCIAAGFNDVGACSTDHSWTCLFGRFRPRLRG